MDHKMVNILTLLLGCACVSAQIAARPPVEAAPVSQDNISPVNLLHDDTPDDLCIQRSIEENGFEVEGEEYTNEEEKKMIASADDSVNNTVPEDAEIFSDLRFSVPQTNSSRSSSASEYHVGYFWRNPCNSTKKFAPLKDPWVTTSNGQRVRVIYPRRFYQVECRPKTSCRCYGRCVQAYSWQWAWVARGCRYYWALIKIPCGCSCHTYFPYYYHY